LVIPSDFWFRISGLPPPAVAKLIKIKNNLFRRNFLGKKPEALRN
jgi:hypothetical protein